MEHDLRFYLTRMQEAIEGEVFAPQHFVTAVKLPNGAIEIAVNSTHIADKIQYILDAYDSEMRLKSNTEIVMQNLLVV